jgi:F-type H+-transporting ATPase subunit gamma
MVNNRRRTSLITMLVAAVVVVLGVHQLRRSAAMKGFVGGSVAATSRQKRICMNGIDKAMKDRINSVTKTGKLTDAMRMVAAAKVRQAQTGVEKSRPFSVELQSMIKGLVKKLKGTGLESELPMLRVPEKVANVGILLIGSDKGLCGAYNSFVQKKTRARILELNEQGIVPKMFMVGKKSVASLKAKLGPNLVKLNFTEVYIPMPNTITAANAATISDALQSYFLSGEVDKVEVVYSQFKNLLVSTPRVRTLLPLSPTGIETAEDETFQMTSQDGKLGVKTEKVPAAKAKDIENDVIFDQPPATILNSMLPLYLSSQLISILYDAQASELAARMNAMKAATDNAKDLSARLTTIFNKKRQAAITAEICEVSAGALALEDGDKTYGTPFGPMDNEDTVLPDLLKELEDESMPDEPVAAEYTSEKLPQVRLDMGYDDIYSGLA